MIRYTKQFVYVMTDKAVSRWEAEAEHLDMYLENCIQREISYENKRVELIQQDIRGNVNNINLQSEENRLKIN